MCGCLHTRSQINAGRAFTYITLSIASDLPLPECPFTGNIKKHNTKDMGSGNPALEMCFLILVQARLSSTEAIICFQVSDLECHGFNLSEFLACSIKSTGNENQTSLSRPVLVLLISMLMGF